LRLARSRLWLPSLAGIVALAGALRLTGINRNWLWYDELLSANFSYGSLVSVVAETLRFDVHPPLYYFQLHFWMLAGTSDQWLMLNPLLWSVAGVASCAWIAGRFYGSRAGLLAGLFMALCAGQAQYAQQVRMYSMLSTLVVWAWYWNRRAVETGAKALRGAWLWALLFESAVVYAHGAGLLMLSGVGVDSLIRSSVAHGRRGMLRWFVVHLTVLALALPAILLIRYKANAVGHLVAPSLAGILSTWSSLAAGRHTIELPTAAAAAFIAAVCIFLALKDREPRLLICCGALAPIASFAGLSHMIRPLWHERNLLVITPFVCLALAAGLDSEGGQGRPARRLTTLLVAAVMATGCIAQQMRLSKGDAFKPASALVRSLAKPGDVVYYRGHEWEFFCFMWYFGGPDWGEPRIVRTFAAPQQWAQRPVIGRLLPLFLLPDPGFFMARGVKVVAEFQQPEPPREARRILRVVSAPRWSRDYGQPVPAVAGRRMVHREPLGAVTVETWE
jgi:hypothetical protein